MEDRDYNSGIQESCSHNNKLIETGMVITGYTVIKANTKCSLRRNG
jgi:hypothetical protein